MSQVTIAATTQRPAQIHIARANPCVSRRPDSCSSPPSPAAAGSAAAEMSPARRAAALFTPDATPASPLGRGGKHRRGEWRDQRRYADAEYDHCWQHPTDVARARRDTSEEQHPDAGHQRTDGHRPARSVAVRESP